MTRSELIARLAARAPTLTPKDAVVSVSLVLNAIVDALVRGDRVEIRGFGSFALHYRKPKKGRNPKSGEPLDIPAKCKPHFKAGKEMRERIEKSGSKA